MTKKRRLISICFAVSSLAIIIPGATYGIISAQSASGSAVNNSKTASDDAPANIVIEQQGTKPAFLNKIETQKQTVVSSSSLYPAPKINSLTGQTVNTKGLQVAANSLGDSLNKTLANELSKNNEVDYAPLVADVNSYLDNLFKANSQYFSLTGNAPVFKQMGTDKLNVQISGDYKFTNVNTEPQAFHDLDGNVIPGLENVAPNAIVKFSFTNNPTIVASTQSASTLNLQDSVTNSSTDSTQLKAIVSVDPTTNKPYLNWSIKSLQITIDDKTTVLSDFIFNKAKSNINVLLSDVAPGIDPYTAQQYIVGKNGKVLNYNTVSGNRVGTDLANIFENRFDLAKQIAKTISGLFGSMYDMHNAGNYKLSDVLVKNAGNIADLLTLNNKSLTQKVNGTASVRDLIYDLLTSSKSNPNGKTFYQIVYKDKDAIINYLVNNVPLAGSLGGVMTDFFKGLSSPDQVFDRLSGLQGTISSLLTSPALQPIKVIFDALVSSKGVYVLDLLSDPKLAPTIFDMIVQLSGNGASLLSGGDNTTTTEPQDAIIPAANDPSGLTKLSLTDFLKKYKSLFINVLTNANDPIDAFVKGLFKDNKAALTDILNMVGFSASSLTPQLKQMFDVFVTKNQSLQDDDATVARVYNLFDQTRKLFSDENLAKITLTKINAANFSSPNIVTNYNDYNDLVIQHLDVGYQISVNNFIIPNSFVEAVVNLLPSAKLRSFIQDNFMTPQLLDQIRQQAITEGNKAKPWYVPQSTMDNILKGNETNPSIVDYIINNLLSGIRANATIQDFVKELLFGNLNPIASAPFLTINGNIKVNYGGDNLIILPAYDVAGNGKTIINYQIVGAKLTIDPTDIAAHSSHTSEYKATDAERTMAGTFKNISEQLYNSVQGLIQNFIKYTAGRIYHTTANVYLLPTKTVNGLTVPYYSLDISDPQQNVAPFAYLNNFTVAKSSLYDVQHIAATKEDIMNKGWSYDGTTPKLSDAAISEVNQYVSMSDGLTSFLSGRYSSNAINLYGSGPSKINFAINNARGDTGAVIFKRIIAYVNLSVSMDYEIRMLDSVTYLPYKVLDISDPQAPKMVQQIHNHMTYFMMGAPTTGFSFSHIGWE
ncbi:P116 family lipid acquisition surface protein [[Mycoplasma] testudinis]|uniref:P116 family lipid acquisition surface protein n=1 Tax=[Mycoplasma] testudinis TaxID=33924 RepID=UPI0004893A3B|nr:hypothetical protein [[Mycoplasma] testudinis]